MASNQSVNLSIYLSASVFIQVFFLTSRSFIYLSVLIDDLLEPKLSSSGGIIIITIIIIIIIIIIVFIIIIIVITIVFVTAVFVVVIIIANYCFYT